MLVPTLEERLTSYARRDQIVAWSRERFGRDGEQVIRQIERGSERPDTCQLHLSRYAEYRL